MTMERFTAFVTQSQMESLLELSLRKVPLKDVPWILANHPIVKKRKQEQKLERIRLGKEIASTLFSNHRILNETDDTRMDCTEDTYDSEDEKYLATKKTLRETARFNRSMTTDKDKDTTHYYAHIPYM